LKKKLSLNSAVTLIRGSVPIRNIKDEENVKGNSKAPYAA
jgi:hypothetical protein